MFEKVLVKTPKRAKFDFSHGNTLSMQFGKLTPTEIRFIVPGDDVSVSMEQIVRLAPMPVPTFVNMKVRHDWFFVPLSMMYQQKALDKLFGQNASSAERPHWNFLVNYVNGMSALPTNYGQAGIREPFVPGSLHDYFNLPVFSDVNCKDSALATKFATLLATPNATNYNSLVQDTAMQSLLGSLPGPLFEPFLAYHYCWRDWYRFTGYDDTYTSDPWLENHILNETSLTSWGSSDDFTDFGWTASDGMYHGSNASFFNYLAVPYFAYLKKDIFTSTRYGTKPQVLIPTGASGTIPNFRIASGLQRFVDIITIAGQRYWDKVKAIWNETPAGMKCERAQFLGRYMSYVKVGEVITTATTSDASTGDYAGRGMLVDGRYIFKRHFNEHGWLMCISSIVPEMAYNGYDRQLTDSNMLDTPVPSFANIGDQSVINREIRVLYDANYPNNSSFGDQFRYYAYKSDVNRIHGDFLMNSFSPWTALLPQDQYTTMDAMNFGRVDALVWNKVFNYNGARNPFYNGRFFVDLTFHEFITRNLPKYVSYAL